MTACCDTDVTVFGHVSAACPDTQVPAWEADAYTGRIRELDQLAWRGNAMAEREFVESREAARPAGPEPQLAPFAVLTPSDAIAAAQSGRFSYVRHRLSQLARSQP